MDEDASHTFSAADFGFADVDAGNILDHVTIAQLPAAGQGQLLLDGHAVAAGQEIDAADIPKLTFQPAPDFNGDVSFRYTVSDGQLDSAETAGMLTVNAVNDAPVVVAADAANAATLDAAQEDAPKTYTNAELLHLAGATDVDGDALSVSDIHIDPAAGTFAKATDGSGDWVFTPSSNFKGDHLPVTLTVSDSHATAEAHAILSVTPVADAPVMSLSLGDAVPVNPVVSLAREGVVTASHNFLGDPSVDFDGLFGTSVLFGAPEDLDKVTAIVAGGTILQLGADIDDPVHGHGRIIVGGEHNDAFRDNNGSGNVKLIFAAGGSAQMTFSMYYVGGGEDFVNDFCSWKDFTIDRTAGGGGPTNHFSASVGEDQDVPIIISLSDPDASESLALTIAGVPAGATLSAGTQNSDGTWSLSPADLAGLHMTPPEDFKGEVNLEVTATSTDHTDTAATTLKLDITVTPVAEAPHLDATDPQAVDEDPGAPIQLDIRFDIHHDATETLAMHIEGVPDDATLSAGTKNADGTWEITPSELSGLTVTPGAQYSGVMALTVVATSTEATGESAEARMPVLVSVHPVIDTTVAVHDLTVGPADVSHGVHLPIDIQNWGIDGSESFATPNGHLAVPPGDSFPAAMAPNAGVGKVFVELPVGASETNGWTVNVDHSIRFIFDWTRPNGTVVPIVAVSPDDLSAVSVTPPSGFTGDMDLRVTGAVSDGTVHHDIDMPFTVHVGTAAPTVVADGPDAVDTDTATVIADQPDHGSAPVDDYMQFADTSATATDGDGAGGNDDPDTTSPVDDYLAAAGVDSHDVSAPPPTDPPPDAFSADDADATTHDDPHDDPTIADVMPVDVPDTLIEDDPQHHDV